MESGILDFAETSGLINPTSRKVWDQYGDYVPFLREQEQGLADGVKVKGGLSHQTAGIRKLTGGQQRLRDPVYNTVTRVAELVDASIKEQCYIGRGGGICKDTGLMEKGVRSAVQASHRADGHCEEATDGERHEQGGSCQPAEGGDGRLAEDDERTAEPDGPGHCAHHAGRQGGVLPRER